MRRVATATATVSAFALLLFSGYGATQTSPDSRETESQLTALKASIATVRAQLEAQEEARDDLQDTLRETEQLIGDLDRQLTGLVDEQQALQVDLASLNSKNRSLQDNQTRLETDIEGGIRQLWLLQQGGGLRVWLGDQDPQQTARHLAYYRLILEAQQKSIVRYQEGLAELATQASAIERKESDLTQRVAAIAATREQLAAQQNTRQQTIARINAQLEADQQQLDALIRDRERLNTLLENLQALVLPEAPVSVPLATLKGQLEMPVEGKPINRFGAVRNADLRWRGWLIPADQGDPVRAVHSGRVIFADWLRGQGLLVVLDHGDGWLSLYAQNHSLLRAAGDWVGAGEVLSRAGSSGGSEVSGLYFEIRHQGEPVDPAGWFRR
jgi:septal ring factor EnvC (AmiA/AmiB activator)